ncbi:MAG: ATP-binding protein, partial [bacterium]
VENFPYAAIEEAVANAVYHRGYDVREPIEVRISKDDLVILSYPGPARSVRLAQLRAGRALPRRYRNRRIGEFLKELDMTEGRSTGIPKILHAMKRNGSPKPEFDFDDDHTFFMCRLPVHPQAAMPDVPPVETTNVPTLSQVCPKSVPSDLFDIILRAAASPVEMLKLMALARHTNRTRFRRTILQPLIEQGIIEPTVPDKPNSRLQKYRLTTKGRKKLASLKGRGRPRRAAYGFENVHS